MTTIGNFYYSPQMTQINTDTIYLKSVDPYVETQYLASQAIVLPQRLQSAKKRIYHR